MKKVFIALTAIIALASCKKENVTNPTNPGATKTLAKFTHVYDNGTPDTEEYIFGTNGKIASIKKTDRTEIFNFVSATSLEVTERFNADNTINSIRYCELNDKGFVTQIVIKSGSGTVLGTYNYTYDAEGYQTGKKLTYPNGNTWEDFFTYADGNLINEKSYNNSVLNDYTDITYDNTKANKTRLTNYSDYWNVPNMFGKGTKHMKSEMKRYNAAGTLTSHIQYTNELDADGYPVKITTNYPLQSKQAVSTYSYQ